MGQQHQTGLTTSLLLSCFLSRWCDLTERPPGLHKWSIFGLRGLLLGRQASPHWSCCCSTALSVSVSLGPPRGGRPTEPTTTTAATSTIGGWQQQRQRRVPGDCRSQNVFGLFGVWVDSRSLSHFLRPGGGDDEDEDGVRQDKPPSLSLLLFKELLGVTSGNAPAVAEPRRTPQCAPSAREARRAGFAGPTRG